MKKKIIIDLFAGAGREWELIRSMKRQIAPCGKLVDTKKAARSEVSSGVDC